ncbi:MAG TPA: transposase, partial [Acidimicrobiales bacterium]|nr:transposase [Acidimicrobiales bacterium]
MDVEDVPGAALRVHMELIPSTQGCPECGVIAHVKDRRRVELVDLSMAGRPMRLLWLKRRFRCPESSCPMGSWTEDDPRIASRRLMMTDRAGRWITEQVGRCARSVSEVARELGCDWHTVNDAVLAYGGALVDHPERFGSVEALGLDEVLMVRRGPFHRQEFSTQLVDVGRGQLLDVVPGRSSTGPMVRLAKKGKAWCDQVRFATLDLSGPYRRVFTLMTPDAVQVADPFHLKVRHEAPCIRRRVRDPHQYASRPQATRSMASGRIHERSCMVRASWEPLCRGDSLVKCRRSSLVWQTTPH